MATPRSPATSPAVAASVPISTFPHSPYYGRDDLCILAGTNPICVAKNGVSETSRPEKLIYPLRSPDFIADYEDRIHPAMIAALRALQLQEQHVAFRCTIVPVCMAWSTPPENTTPGRPIVILAIFSPTLETQDEEDTHIDLAKKLCRAIADSVQKGQTATDKVFVDVCIPSRWLNDTRSESGRGDSWKGYENDYRYAAPLPGSSIGTAEGKPTGSLCGYFKHDDQIYSMTNYHVVKDGVPKAAYLFTEGDTKVKIKSPSDSDHKQNLGNMEDDRAPPTVATQYNRDLGHIVASSGVVKPQEEKRRFDWALIHCDSLNRSLNSFQNKCFGNFTQPSHILRRIDRETLCEEANVAEQWILDFCHRMLSSPLFQGISEAGVLLPPPCHKDKYGSGSVPIQPNSLYVKPPSARSGFTFGQANGVKATLVDSDWGITREDTIISVVGRTPFSKSGDSGSPVLDANMMVTGILWGGSKYNKTDDLTFVTPIADVLREMENMMGWQRGTLDLLGGSN